MAWCLIPKKADEFIEKLKSGDINPVKLAKLSSEKRRTYLGKIVGDDNAIQVNSLFESKLLLKDQQRGLVTWAKRVSGLTPPARRDLIARIERMEAPLSPISDKLFLKDLVDTRLGVNVTAEEARKIMTLSNKLQSASKTLDKERISEFGRTTHQMYSFLEEKTPAKKGVKGTAEQIAALERAAITSIDISGVARQAAPYIGTKEWFGALGRLPKYIKSKADYDKLAMKMYSDPRWDTISKIKNDLGLTNIGATMTQKEEAYASAWGKKIPGIAHSDRAYSGFLSDLRYHRFVNTLDVLEKNGQKLSENEMRDLAQVISGSSGRGYLPGSLRMAGNALSQAMFSPRWFASKLQIVTNPFVKKGAARTEAVKSLARLAGISASLVLIAKSTGGNIELDSRSSDFGKLKVGNTRIDLTFGQGQYIRALTQIATGQTKSTLTGEIKQLNEGDWGGRTKLNVLGDFLRSKGSPMMTLMMDFLEGQDFEGNKLGVDIKNLRSEKNLNSVARVLNMFVPLVGQDAMDAYYEGVGMDEKSLNNLAISLGLGVIGVGVQTYGGYKADLKDKGFKDTRTLLERTLGKPVEPEIENESLVGKMIYEMTDQKAKDKTKKSGLEILKSTKKNKADIKGILNKYFTEEEKDLKDKKSKAHLKMMKERQDRLDNLLKELGF